MCWELVFFVTVSVETVAQGNFQIPSKIFLTVSWGGEMLGGHNACASISLLLPFLLSSFLVQLANVNQI